jgi:tRNA G18 (ribose-2'-O)-methylase SpoU
MLLTFSRWWKSVRKEYENLIVLVGNEVYGIDANTLNILGTENTIAIPMKGIKSSLNVGQASAILMWELRS